MPTQVFVPGTGTGKPYYDRNPVLLDRAYNAGGVAPHATIERANYTVPAAKRAILHAWHIHLLRITAPTTSGNIQGDLRIIRTGGGTTPIYNIRLRDATVGAQAQGRADPQILLESGDQVSLQSGDSSVDGTVDYAIVCSLTEFDA